MSEVIIRNTISNTNFIIEYNLDMNLPKEADDSQKFLEDLINNQNSNIANAANTSKTVLDTLENNYEDENEIDEIILVDDSSNFNYNIKSNLNNINNHVKFNEDESTNYISKNDREKDGGNRRSISK